MANFATIMRSEIVATTSPLPPSVEVPPVEGITDVFSKPDLALAILATFVENIKENIKDNPWIRL